MKLKLLIFKIILSLLFLTGNSFAKNIPPGSGIGDVPANVLILLDKSGSMGVRMMTGASMYYPQAVKAHNGKIYVAQHYSNGIKSIDHDSGKLNSSFGNKGTYRGSGNCRVYYPYGLSIDNGYLYVASYYRNRIFRINLSTNACDWNTYLRYPYNINVKNNKLISVGRWGNYIVRDMAKGTNSSCSINSRFRYARSVSYDASGSNIWVQNSSYLYKYAIQSNGCPSSSHSNNVRVNGLSSSYGLAAHPTDDNILYLGNRYRHRLEKLTISGNTLTNSKTVGRCCRGPWRLYYPSGVGVDTVNNRVYITSYYGGNVNSYDLNLGQVKDFGGSSGTRMTGAHEAIKAIVTDSSLTAGVNFGFGWWSSGGGQYSGWDTSRDQGRPCGSRYCLKVRVNKDGAAKTNKAVSSVNPGGGTDAYAWARMAKEYYSHNTGPIDNNSPCQNSYVLVIGDGQWYNHSRAKSAVTSMLNNQKIKTFTVAYGGGIHGSGIRNFRQMAQAGGTNDVIIADTTADLKAQLKAAISQIIASKLSFTAPAITATIEQGGSLFQAQFDYVQNKEWKGTLTRTAISSSGVIDTNDKSNWSAARQLPTPDKRKIWSEIPGKDYKSDLNNFVEANYLEIDGLFGQTGNKVPKYHNIDETYTVTENGVTTKYENPKNTTRCKNAPGVRNDNEDDIKGLINFIRGKDYFDYDGDCNLTETRDNPLGDIYHSEMVVLGAPSAETAFVGNNQEAYWRSIKGYDSWAAGKSTREEIIYVGANDGMLHAFNSKTGKEEWAFVPPFVASSMPTMVNVNLNRSGIGGSNAIYGVDGSPVIHDMYFQGPYDTAKTWHTILMIPYGRGGAGFSVLDVTNPKAPRHLHSVLNDTIMHQVHVMDHTASINSYSYIATSYPLSSFNEAIKVTDNKQEGTGDEKCDDTENHQCYKSKTWTLPVTGLSQADVSVVLDGKNYSNFKVTSNTSGQTQIVFGNEMTYYGYDPNDASKASSDLGLYIKPGSSATGVQTQPEYDYSQLGETWSAPRIMRLPNNGAGDQNIEDDIYVAVMGGGFGAQHSGFGSNLTIVNLEDTTFPGRVHKVIPIEDLPGNNIVNSTPGSAVVITPDTARGVSYRGALVYLNDLEGKITKFNLTNLSGTTLYDKTTLFNAGSNSTNGRYMYHSMDATIGQTTNALWLYSGTGDYERIGSRNKGTDNLMLGIADPDYPLFKSVKVATKADDLTKCKNTSKDSSGALCPQLPGNRGWYIQLKDYKKVTAEPTVSSGLVYFPIYSPSSSVNKCSLGDAFICAVDDECGTNISSRLGKNTGAQKNAECFYVGQGVLSRIVTFAGKLFANIAGQSTQAKKDLVTLDGATADVTTYRSSWRYNY